MNGRSGDKWPLTKSAAALLLGLILSLCLLGGLEIGLRNGYRLNLKFLEGRAPKKIKPSRKRSQVAAFPPYVRDPFVKLREKEKKLGSLGPIQREWQQLDPYSYRSQARTAQGELIYDVTYHYRDDRRITPGQPARSRLSVILMGCSFTLGEGLEEDQTLPAFLQRLMKDATVHNAAWHGLGPGDLLLSVRQDDPQQWPSPLKGVPQAPKTIGIFVLGDNHFNRIECGLDCRGTQEDWLRARPDFQPGESGKLVYRGRMRETRAFPRWLELLADSAIVSEFGLQGIGRFSQSRQEKMAKILISLREELAAKTELQDFYVFHHPQRVKHDLTPLNDLLRAAGIKVLDPNLNVKELTGYRFAIPVDNHPSPHQNYLLADYLKSVLNGNEPNPEERQHEN